MKRLIRADKPAYGVSVQFPSAEIVEMIGELAFDRVMLGAEHGSITPDNAGPAVINKYLDRGAMGVQVPHVNTAAGARAVVEAVPSPPAGHAGTGRRQNGRLWLGLTDFGVCQGRRQGDAGVRAD